MENLIGFQAVFITKFAPIQSTKATHVRLPNEACELKMD